MDWLEWFKRADSKTKWQLFGIIGGVLFLAIFTFAQLVAIYLYMF